MVNCNLFLVKPVAKRLEFNEDRRASLLSSTIKIAVLVQLRNITIFQSGFERKVSYLEVDCELVR